MNRTRSILIHAVTLLAATGCVEDKPAPRLSSPDRSERVEAVKVARNKYGARAPAAPTVSKPAKPPAPVIIPSTLSPKDIDLALVGRWTGSWLRCSDYQFAADGTYTNDTLLYTFKGTWTTPYPGTLVCRYSVFGAYDFRQYTYRVKGDTLELDNGLDRFAYTKEHP